MIESYEQHVIPALHKERWVFITIKITGEQDEVLYTTVAPFANKIISNGYASKFIYSKAREGLYLFFKTCPLDSELHIKPLLAQSFQEDQIDYTDYYLLNFGEGNPVSMSDLLMSASSKIISQFFEEANGEWTIEMAIEKAFPFHLAFLQAFGLDLHEIHVFYSVMLKDMLVVAAALQEDQETWKANLEEQLTMNFELQKEGLVGYSESIYSALIAGESFEDDWINQWKETALLAYDELLRLKATAEFNFPEPTYDAEDVAGIDLEKLKSWPLLKYYIRFLNGQLGIGWMFEYNFLYSLKESLKCIRDSEDATV